MRKEGAVKRWNGWGSLLTEYPLPASAARFLAEKVGPGSALPDADLANVLAGVPPSRLPPQPLLSFDPEDRLRHARGQSLPDWIALRSGRIETFPDAVAYPCEAEEVRRLFDFARQTGAALIPYGGGTSVVGHVNPLPGDRPVLTVDLSRMNRLLHLDETSRLANFQAGVSGPEIEAQLQDHGYTLGHYPQSFEFSTLGGWIAARSSGQQSYYYGRIEELFAGGQVETPAGPLALPPLPASAAGPDLRQMVLGSEGRLGIITGATVRICPLPEREHFYGVFFRDWNAGVSAMRSIAQSRIPVSMLRLSDAQETETTLALSGKEALVRWADRGLRLLDRGPGRCLMIFGATGGRRAAAHARSEALAACRRNGGLFTGSRIGQLWRKSRFLTPYLRNTLWEAGYALDTLETALPWSGILTAAVEIKEALQDTALTIPGLHVFAHLSHVYLDGASLYATYLYRRSADPDETLQNWKALKHRASQVVLRCGGTISHQHGVGRDHAPYLPAEKSPAGMDLLGAACRALDSQGMMNPGKLLVEGAAHG
jgi:alkyldihydroxyacetonephosphate synthase